MTKEEAMQKRDIIVTQFINELGVTIETNTKPLIRCKDCRHRDLFSCPLADNDFQTNNDFCSWGERREDGEG